MRTRKLNQSVTKGMTLSIFLALSVLSLVIMSYKVKPRDFSDDFLASLIDKDDLLATLAGPRLIFVGGSNLAFGLDSEFIENSSHLPVINCGLHAGLGLSFMLNDVKTFLKEGDIVVLSTEYDLDLRGQPPLFTVLEQIYPKALKYTEDQQEWRTHVREVCLSSQASFRDLCRLPFPNQDSNPYSGYSRAGFNRYGDNVGHFGLESKKIGIGGLSGKCDRSDMINALNDFASFAKSRGAQVCFIYPPVAASSFYANKSSYEDFRDQMRHKLHIPILSEPEDFALADDLFFDTHYHLNKEGRQIRTERLVRHLLIFFNSMDNL